MGSGQQRRLFPLRRSGRFQDRFLSRSRRRFQENCRTSCFHAGCRRERHLAWKQDVRSEEHTSELQSHSDLVCRLLLGKKNNTDQVYSLSIREEDTVLAAGVLIVLNYSPKSLIVDRAPSIVYSDITSPSFHSTTPVLVA